MKNILSPFVVAFVLFGVNTQAHAFEKYMSRTRGNQANFSTWSDSECGYSGVSVWAFEENQHGNQTSYGSIFVDYYRYDYCTGDSEYGWASFDAASFDMQRLASASLDATGSMELFSCSYPGFPMPGGDPGEAGAGGAAGAPGETDGGVYEDPCTYTSAPIELGLDWTGTGETSRERWTSSYSTPYSRYRDSYTGQYREATVTGLFTIGGEALDLSAGYGSLAQTTSGYFEMIH